MIKDTTVEALRTYAQLVSEANQMGSPARETSLVNIVNSMRKLADTIDGINQRFNVPESCLLIEKDMLDSEIHNAN